MANRNDETRSENGIPNGSFGQGAGPGDSRGTEGRTSSWNQGFHGGTGERQGRFYGRAMDRLGERRGERAPGEIGHGRGIAGGGEDDPRSRVHHPMTRPAPGSYTEASYGGSAVYGSSGEYLGGTLGDNGPLDSRGVHGRTGTPGAGYAYNDRRGPAYRGERGGEDRSEYWEHNTGRSEFRGGEGYDREYGRELGSSADRLGYTGMRTEAHPVRSRWLKEPLAARDVMTKDPRTVQPSTTLKDASAIMRDEDTGIVPVVAEGGRLRGVLTDRDMVVRAFAFDKVPGQMRVEDVMSEDVECVTADESVHEILELMGHKQVRRIPVVDRDDRLIGIVSLGDIAQKADTDEELQEALHHISSRRSFWHRLFR